MVRKAVALNAAGSTKGIIKKQKGLRCPGTRILFTKLIKDTNNGVCR